MGTSRDPLFALWRELALSAYCRARLSWNFGGGTQAPREARTTVSALLRHLHTLKFPSSRG